MSVIIFWTIFINISQMFAIVLLHEFIDRLNYSCLICLSLLKYFMWVVFCKNWSNLRIGYLAVCILLNCLTAISGSKHTDRLFWNNESLVGIVRKSQQNCFLVQFVLTACLENFWFEFHSNSSLTVLAFLKYNLARWRVIIDWLFKNGSVRYRLMP